MRAAVEQGLIGPERARRRAARRHRHPRRRGRAAGRLRRGRGARHPGAAHLRREGRLARAGTAAARRQGIGCEVASPGELALARAAGRAAPSASSWTPPPRRPPSCARRSPSASPSTPTTRRSSARIDALLRLRRPRRSPLGLRVNPQVGGGTIGAMSTATATSKFGVALRDPGAREWVVRAYRERPWLTRLHAHVGSQGMPLELMAAGVAGRRTNSPRRSTRPSAGSRSTPSTSAAACRSTSTPTRSRPTYAEYARLLRADRAGALRRAVRPGHRVRPVAAGQERARSLARVEYAKSAGGRPIAVTHAGAQVATRTVFVPDAWPLRVAAYDAEGRPKAGADGGAGHRGAVLLRGRPGGRGPAAAAAGAGRPTWRCWTPARTTSPTTSPTTACPGPAFTATPTRTTRSVSHGVRTAPDGGGDRGGKRRRRTRRRCSAVEGRRPGTHHRWRPRTHRAPCTRRARPARGLTASRPPGPASPAAGPVVR